MSYWNVPFQRQTTDMVSDGTAKKQAQGTALKWRTGTATYGKNGSGNTDFKLTLPHDSKL